MIHAVALRGDRQPADCSGPVRLSCVWISLHATLCCPVRHAGVPSRGGTDLPPLSLLPALPPPLLPFIVCRLSESAGWPPSLPLPLGSAGDNPVGRQGEQLPAAPTGPGSDVRQLPTAARRHRRHTPDPVLTAGTSPRRPVATDGTRWTRLRVYSSGNGGPTCVPALLRTYTHGPRSRIKGGRSALGSVADHLL